MHTQICTRCQFPLINGGQREVCQTNSSSPLQHRSQSTAPQTMYLQRKCHGDFRGGYLSSGNRAVSPFSQLPSPRKPGSAPAPELSFHLSSSSWPFNRQCVIQDNYFIDMSYPPFSPSPKFPLYHLLSHLHFSDKAIDKPESEPSSLSLEAKSGCHNQESKAHLTGPKGTLSPERIGGDR